jgi:hypothetical protein
MCQKFVFRGRVLLALNEPHMKHRVSVEITLNMLSISQKRNVSNRLIVTARYIDSVHNL